MVVTSWWLWLLGIERQSLPRDWQVELEWSGAVGSWRVLVLVAGLGLVGWGLTYLYRGERPAVSAGVRRGLVLCRWAVWVMLAIVLAQPVLRIWQVQVREPAVVVVVDDSLSMSVHDAPVEGPELEKLARLLGWEAQELKQADPSRLELVERLLKGGFLEKLGLAGPVRVWLLSQLTGAAGEETKAFVEQQTEECVVSKQGVGGNAVSARLPMLRARLPSTDLALAVREAVRRTAGQAVGAVVLISDGQHNEADDPAAAAQWVGTRGIPLFCLGVGQTSAPRNIRVVDLLAPQTVWQNDPFELEATIEWQGIREGSFQLQLLEQVLEEESEAGGMVSTGGGRPVTVLEECRLKVAEEGGQDQPVRQRVNFRHRPTRAGRLLYTVQVTPVAGEFTDRDNSRSVSLAVLDQQARLLLVAGGPSWDYQLLKNLLLRDKSVRLSCWLQTLAEGVRQEGHVPIDHLPVTPAELFEYDAVLMLDPDPEPIPSGSDSTGSWIALLKRFVGEQAGGFFFGAGPVCSARFLTHSQTRMARNLLPVIFPEDQPLDVEALMRSYVQSWPLRPAAEAADHPLLRLAEDPQASLRVWKSLPGVYWSFPALAAKPAARTLLEHSDPTLRTAAAGGVVVSAAVDVARPILVTGQFGAGRTVYLGIDSTWRWRSVGRDSQYFDRFWIQLVRYLVEGRRVGQSRRGSLMTDASVYSLGATVRVTARLFDTSFEPLDVLQVIGQWQRPDGSQLPVVLRPVPDRAGFYEASLAAGMLGVHLVRLPVAVGEEGMSRVTGELLTRFSVEMPQREFTDVRQDRRRLVQMAQQSGGTYFELTEADRLTEAIPSRRERVMTVGPSVSLWDRPWVLGVLVLLLALEWAVRKMVNLL